MLQIFPFKFWQWPLACKMGLFSTNIFICFAAFAVAVVVVVDSLNILQIAPNFLDTHYQLSVRFADLLASNEHYVHFLVPLSKPSTSWEDPLLEKAHVQICKLTEHTLKWMDKPPADSEFINPPPEHIQKGGWSARHYMQSPAIAYVEGFEVIADIVRQEHCWSQLSTAHENQRFDVGLMDVWDFGALALFHQLGIKNVVLTHNFPIMSHMYDYMTEAKWPSESSEILDYKEQIIVNGVPELFSSVVEDHNIGKGGVFAEKHAISVNIFSTVYEKADQEFRKLFNNDALPALKQLFGQAKYLYINTIPSLDYRLGKLPKQVKFVGGIDLLHAHPRAADLTVKQILEKEHKVIMFSMSSLLEPAKMPKEKFKTIVRGLGMLNGITVLWKYDSEKLNYQKNHNELLQNVPGNVHLVKEFDTSKFIGNKNVILVISECDIRSAMDALSVKKPLLCMPMFVEQFYVAEKLRRDGTAVVVDPRAKTFDSEAIVHSIEAQIKKANDNALKFPEFASDDAIGKMILNDLAKLEKD